MERERNGASRSGYRPRRSILEVPLGFEPRMEALQASALPLGDGTDRDQNPNCAGKRRPRPAFAIVEWQIAPRSTASQLRELPAVTIISLSRTSEAKFGSGEWASGRTSVRPERSEAVVKGARRGAGGPPIRSAPGTERQRVKGARRGAGGPADTLINGAGNGIRTRDFDLGKVALYH